MSRIRTTIRSFKRNLWRRSEGYIYYREPTTNESNVEHTDDVSLRLLDDAEIRSTQEWSEITEVEERRRRDRGDRCYGIDFENEIVHLIWISTGTNLIRGADLVISLSHDEWYVFGVITKPTARGKGIYKKAQQQLLQIAHKNGIRKIVAYVERSNPIPQKIYQRLNYDVTPPVTSRRFMSLRFGNHFDSAISTVRPLLIGTSESKDRWI